MKKFNILLIIIAITFSNCLSLKISDISPEIHNSGLNPVVEMHGDINANIEYDGKLHSSGNLYYKDYERQSGENYLQVNFNEFSGENFLSLKITEPTTLHLMNNLNLNSGNIGFRVTDENEVQIWQKDFSDNTFVDQTDEITISEKGTYKISIYGKKAKGSYILQWY